MIQKLYTALYADGLVFFDEDSGNVTFCYNEMGILSKINLDNNCHEDDLDSIILIRLLAYHNEF